MLFVIWLAIGAVAAGQRGYFGGTPQDCAGAATIGVTVCRTAELHGSQTPRSRASCRSPRAELERVEGIFEYRLQGNDVIVDCHGTTGISSD